MRKDSEAPLLTLSHIGHYKAAAETRGDPSEGQSGARAPTPEPPPRRGATNAPRLPLPRWLPVHPSSSSSPDCLPREMQEEDTVPDSALSPPSRSRSPGQRCLPGAAAASRPAALRQLCGAARGGRGTPAAAGGLSRVPSPAPGIPRPHSRRGAPGGPAPLPVVPHRARAVPPCLRGIPLRSRPGGRCSPEVPLRAPGIPLCGGVPLPRFPLLSRSVPALRPSVPHSTPEVSPRSRGRPARFPGAVPQPPGPRADPAAPLPRVATYQARPGGPRFPAARRGQPVPRGDPAEAEGLGWAGRLPPGAAAAVPALPPVPRSGCAARPVPLLCGGGAGAAR